MYLARSARYTELLGFLTAGLAGGPQRFLFLPAGSFSTLRTFRGCASAIVQPCIPSAGGSSGSGPWGLPLGGQSAQRARDFELGGALGFAAAVRYPLQAAVAVAAEAVFQYWGLWFLLAMILQAVFGYAIGRELPAEQDRQPAARGMPRADAGVPVSAAHPHGAGRPLDTTRGALPLHQARAAAARYAWPLLLAVTASVHALPLGDGPCESGSRRSCSGSGSSG